MTIREIFVKMLGATLKVVYDSITDQIIAEELPVYSIDADGNVTATPYTYIEIAAGSEVAGEIVKPTQSGFYQIKDSSGNVIESGYQEVSDVNLNHVYHIAFPEAVDFNVSGRVDEYDELGKKYSTVWDVSTGTKLITLTDDLTVIESLYDTQYYAQIKAEEDALPGYNMWLIDPNTMSPGKIYRFIIE